MRSEAYTRVLTFMSSLSINELVHLKRSCDLELVWRIRAGRQDGRTWAELAKELEVSAPEAHRRYSRLQDGPTPYDDRAERDEFGTEPMT